MTSYILKRFLLLIPTFFGITVMTFCIIQLAPGSPVSLKLLGPGGAGVRSENISKEIIEQTKKMYGLDQPLRQAGNAVGHRGRNRPARPHDPDAQRRLLLLSVLVLVRHRFRDSFRLRVSSIQPEITPSYAGGQ